MNISPTYGTGFARAKGESEFPEMWTGLVGAWAPFLGASGKLMDWSGNQNHGTLNNGPVWRPGALEFDDTAQSYVDTGDPFNPGANGHTIIVRFKVHDLTTRFRFIGNGGTAGADDGWTIELNGTAGGDPVAYIHYGIDSVVSGADPVAVNTWTTMAFVWGGGTPVHVYRNGVLLLTSTMPGGAYNASDDSLYIGATNDQGADEWWLDGQIAFVYIYDHALNAGEISRHYANEKGLFIPRRKVFGFVPAVGGVVVPQIQFLRMHTL